MYNITYIFNITCSTNNAATSKPWVPPANNAEKIYNPDNLKVRK